MLDFPATAQALWAGYDSGKLPRPEYLLPVLFSESGFSTSVTNSIGCVGLNQLCPFAWPIPPGYASWTASQQIAGPISSMFAANKAKFGPLNSGTRVYQSNFLPATLATAKDLDSVIAKQGGAVYAANSGLDYQHTGAIRVSDLAHFVARAAANSTVQSAIAQTYALRPGESPEDPVYGTDFGHGGVEGLPFSHVALIGAGVASAVLLGWLAYQEYKRPGYVLPGRVAA
ncbi:MAG: hypothetical protein KGI71_04875 [Patescibacteria group bacterium]|nr:hypothetical protein [Patescibacteria group bacterium]